MIDTQFNQSFLKIQNKILFFFTLLSIECFCLIKLTQLIEFRTRILKIKKQQKQLSYIFFVIYWPLIEKIFC